MVDLPYINACVVLQTEKKAFVEEMESSGATVTVVDGKAVPELAALLHGGFAAAEALQLADGSMMSVLTPAAPMAPWDHHTHAGPAMCMSSLLPAWVSQLVASTHTYLAGML